MMHSLFLHLALPRCKPCGTPSCLSDCLHSLHTETNKRWVRTINVNEKERWSSWSSRLCNGAVTAVKIPSTGRDVHKSQPSDVFLKACARGDGEMEYQSSGAMHGDDCGLAAATKYG